MNSKKHDLKSPLEKKARGEKPKVSFSQKLVAIQNAKEGLHLKPGRDKSCRGFHPWIFSGAVASMQDAPCGSLLNVYSAEGDFLGQGMCNKKSQIICRMISFDKTPVEEVLKNRIEKAYQFRKAMFSKKETNAYRLINAEGDFLPGLIVDVYDHVVVMQISTLGMEKQKGLIVDLLVTLLSPSWIYEKSTAASRKEEGLQPFEATLWGQAQDEVIVKEDGIQFIVNPKVGQKTGFFLDQRRMRELVGELSCEKKVLNCFSYSGGFSLHALQQKASCVDSVDISKEAIDLLQRNIAINGFSDRVHHEYAEDVFSFLKTNPLDYDLVILDPPAFAKRKHDITQASRGYKEINRLAMSKMPQGSLLLTCSCSYFITDTLFRQILFAAAKDARRDVQIIQHHRLAEDHPANIYHPEGEYLKSFLCLIN